MVASATMWPFLLLCLFAGAIGFGVEVDERIAEADALYETMLEHYRAGRYADAEVAAVGALALSREALDPNHEDVAIAASNLAMMLRAQGKVGAALPLLEEALAISRSGPDPVPEHVATYLDNLAGLHRQRGAAGEALDLYVESLALWEGALAPNHPDVAMSLNNVAMMMNHFGRVEEAREYYTRSLAIYEEISEPDDPDLGVANGNFGSFLQSLGHHVEARRFFERALAIVEEGRPAGHPENAVELANMATVLSRMGDHELALEYGNRALQIMERAYPGHVRLGALLANLAGIETNLRNLDGAEVLIRRALESREATLGMDHPMTARTLLGLCDVLVEAKRARECEPLMARALETMTSAYGPDHSEVRLATSRLGEMHLQLGELEAALSAHQSVVASWERQDTARPEYLLALARLAEVYRAKGEMDSARALYARATELSTVQMTEVLPTLSEREGLEFMAAHQGVLWRFLSVFTQEGDARTAWDAALQWKGAVARQLTSRQGGARGNPALLDDLKALEQVRLRIGQLTLGASGADTDLSEWVAERDALERRLSAADDTLAARFHAERASIDEICEALPPGSALVDYVEYRRPGSMHYAAFALGADDCIVHRVELGQVDEIDPMIASHLAALNASDGRNPISTSRIDQRGAVVRDAIWTPLEGPLGETDRVFIVGDGQLATVSFAALPVGDEQYLVEQIQLSYLETAEAVLRWSDALAPDDGALLVGGVDYGEIGPGRAGCVADDYAQLPGTTVEIDAVREAWQGSKRAAKRGPVVQLGGKEADEAHVLEALSGKRLIHLATHGFFANRICRSALETDVGVGVDPMALSGLVVAGVNLPRAPLDPEDGILTASEVSTLDLRGTELVVLSACDSGLGDLRAGQGVMGLRRAFSSTGARSMIMSLWSIPDEQTTLLMGEFYAKYLHKRRPESPGAALRHAQLQILEQNRREHGEGRPSDWGAFIVAGGWR